MTKLRRNPASPRPLVAQIWGKDPELYFKAATDLATMGFAGIDINMGCPEKGIVARGCCGGLIGRYDEAAAIIAATKAGAGDVPVSLKTRIGLGSIITEDWFTFLLRQDLAALTVHGRTVREMSKVPAHWDEVAKVVALRDRLSPGTLIIGNGDVADRGHGLDRVAESGVDGIMIGRGIFHDIDAFAHGPVPADPARQLAILRHLDAFEAEWRTGKSFQILKKFFKVYVNGWPGAAELRARLMDAATPGEVRVLLDEQFIKG